MHTEFEIFSHAPFPVFVTNRNNTVIFKNIHCSRYLPNIRCGAGIKRHLTNQALDLSSPDLHTVEFAGANPFFRAIITRRKSEDTVYSIFLFPSRYQFEDYKFIENFILMNFSGDAIEFFEATVNVMIGNTSGRLYGELLNFVNKYHSDWNFAPQTNDIEDLLVTLFANLDGAFRSLGIRIITSISPEVIKHKYCNIKSFDFMFFICRMIYFAARCSQDNIISIDAVYTGVTNSVTVTVRTRSENEIIIGDICELAPECIYESEIINRVPSISKNFQIKKSEDGYVEMSYKAECKSEFKSFALKNTYDTLKTENIMVKKRVSEITDMLRRNSKS